MENRVVQGELRYKDRGKITYRVIEGFDGEQDYLGLIYSDDEKMYEWGYHFTERNCGPLKHVKNASYDELKAGFVENINQVGHVFRKGEYQLLKEAIVIFVSHKEYIYDICLKQGLCE